MAMGRRERRMHLAALAVASMSPEPMSDRERARDARRKAQGRKTKGRRGDLTDMGRYRGAHP